MSGWSRAALRSERYSEDYRMRNAAPPQPSCGGTGAALEMVDGSDGLPVSLFILSLGTARRRPKVVEQYLLRNKSSKSGVRK